MLGRHVRDAVEADPALRADADWAFVTRADGDLTKADDVDRIFKRHQLQQPRRRCNRCLRHGRQNRWLYRRDH
jgi:hypothetical protein